MRREKTIFTQPQKYNVSNVNVLNHRLLSVLYSNYYLSISYSNMCLKKMFYFEKSNRLRFKVILIFLGWIAKLDCMRFYFLKLQKFHIAFMIDINTVFISLLN